MTTEQDHGQDQPESDAPKDSENQAPADSRSISGDSDTADQSGTADAGEAPDEAAEAIDVADAQAIDPDVDTAPLERSQDALDEARDAAKKALSDTPPDDEDMNFDNFEQNTDPEAEDNAVPRPS